MEILTIKGNLTDDPKLTYLKDTGMPVADFTIASNYKQRANFRRCKMWGKPAESFANNANIKKGTGVLAYGILEYDSYEKDGREIRTETLNVNGWSFAGGKKED